MHTSTWTNIHTSTMAANGMALCIHPYIHMIYVVHMYIQCGEMRIWGSVRMMKIYYEMGERDYGLYLYTVEKRDN